MDQQPQPLPVSPISAASPNKLAWGPLSAIVVSFSAYFASQISLFVPLIILAIVKPKIDIQNLIDTSPWVNLALTGLASITLLLVLWRFLHHRKAGFKDLGFKKFKKSDFGWLAIGAVAYFVLLVGAMAIASLIPSFNLDQTQDVGYQGVNGWQLGLAFVGLVVLPPIAEETMFRGFLYRGLASRWSKVIAALIASGLFALVHFQWNVGLDVFILSLVMIALFEKTKNLWVCVALHTLKNGLAFLTLFVFTNH